MMMMMMMMMMMLIQVEKTTKKMGNTEIHHSEQSVHKNTHHHHLLPPSPPKQQQPQHITPLHIARRASVQFLPVGVLLLHKSTGSSSIEQNVLVGRGGVEGDPFLSMK